MLIHDTLHNLHKNLLIPQQSMDNEKQKDELVALESIYNDEEFSYHMEDEKCEIILKIFISLPENYFFTYKDINSENDQQIKKVPISHLPPLTLLIELPQDYPSTCPPKFTLRSSWLNVSSIAKLCKKLDELWESNKGQEILFTWVGFLQSESLEFLNINECINIDHAYKLYNGACKRKATTQETINEEGSAASANTKCTDKTVKVENVSAVNSNQRDKKCVIRRRMRKSRNRRALDQRAVYDMIVGRNPVQMLKDYNEMRNQIEFRKNFYSCKICFVDKLGEQSTQFVPCDHVFCKDCIMGYFEVKIKDGSVQSILCPEENCKSEATPGQVII